jgi:hypothetical protein
MARRGATSAARENQEQSVILMDEAARRARPVKAA